MAGDTPLANQVAGDDPGRVLTLVTAKFEMLDKRFDDLDEHIEEWRKVDERRCALLHKKLLSHETTINNHEKNIEGIVTRVGDIEKQLSSNDVIKEKKMKSFFRSFRKELLITLILGGIATIGAVISQNPEAIEWLIP